MNQLAAINAATAVTVHRVEIERTHFIATGPRYRVTFNGAVLVENARDPEHEACRALLAQGITGKLETYFPGGAVARMRLDIEKAADLTVSEGCKTGLKRIRWQPFPTLDGEDLGTPASE